MVAAREELEDGCHWTAIVKAVDKIVAKARKSRLIS